MKPQIPVLSGSVVNSFAYFTIKDRMPSILAKTVDNLVKQNSPAFKTIINKIGALRHEITRNKELPIVEDKLWKHLIESIETKRTWFDSPWIIVECLMYKLLWDMCKEFPQPLDMFHSQKHAALLESIPQMQQMAILLKADSSCCKDNLKMALNWSLWGNQSDLSLIVEKSFDTQKESHLLVDDSQELVSKLLKIRNVVIILDNAGLELYSDLCLGQLLALNGVNVVFHYKEYPWFVSDTTKADINELFEICGNNDTMRSQIELFKKFLETEQWKFETDPFWTSGYTFWDLPTIAPTLADKLKTYDLVIFKGDLNYRKTVYDAAWPVTTKLEDALGPLADFDTSISWIRTIKSETCVGLTESKAEWVRKIDPEWMINGQWGLIQYKN